ncbi:MAG: prepilin-type N-terminal cleavage/methylation domain-containing protein [Verrucomicrobiota bacterium]
MTGKKKSLGTDSRGFTLVELLVSMSILVLMTVLMLSVVSSTQNIWRQNASRTEEFREARRAFDRINQQLAQATLNVYWDYVDASGNPRSATSGYSYTTGTFQPTAYFRLSELRFIITRASGLTPPHSNGTMKGLAVFFQAPVGSATGNNLSGMNYLVNTIGYYVEKGSNAGMIPIPPLTTNFAKDRYRVYEMIEPTENLTIYSLTSGTANYPGKDWFTTPLASGTGAYSCRLADNIVALLFRADYRDKIGATGTNKYAYDSTPQPRPLTSQPIEENNLPPNIHITMIAVDEISGRRITDQSIPLTDAQNDNPDPLSGSGPPQDPSSLSYLEKQLIDNHLNYRKFESTIKIGSSKWSSQ